MEQEFFVFQPCKTTAAFQGTLKKQVELDMNKIKKVLEKDGYEIKLFVDDLIIAKKDVQINIFKNGKIMLKDITDESKARKIISSIYKKIIK